LLEEGGLTWAAERLSMTLNDANIVEICLAEQDTTAALKIVLAFCSESTARNLAPIAETLFRACNITLAPESSEDWYARSAAARTESLLTIATGIGETTTRRTSRRYALHATRDTTCAPDLPAAHRRAERRAKRLDGKIVAAYGDAVVPQIPEAIGRAIWRVEAALRRGPAE
jgi:hypothetical protein